MSTTSTRPETAVSQLADRLRETTPGQQWLAPITIAHARGLMAIIADLCDDHVTCVHCNTHLCDNCLVGEIADCAGDYVHCVDCSPDCPVCSVEIARDTHAELLRGER